MNRASSARVLVIAATAALALGAPCQPFATVKLDQPRAAQLFDDPSPLVHGAGRVGGNFALASILVRLDGIDLGAAVGLAPPFQNQGGAVVLPSGPVTISAFSVSSSGGQHSVAFDAAGLAESPHSLEISAERIADLVVVTASSSFALVSPLALAAQGIPAAARSTPVAVPGGVLAHQTAGDAGAAAPVAIPGGTQLRSGFVPVAEALVTAP